MSRATHNTQLVIEIDLELNDTYYLRIRDGVTCHPILQVNRTTLNKTVQTVINETVGAAVMEQIKILQDMCNEN